MNTTGSTATLFPDQPNPSGGDQRAIAAWLLVCCALIFAMVILGGVTRLTGSGLSMVEWKPVTGFIPPLSHSAWEEEFSKYKKSPEFQKINLGMSLEQFKRIYLYEFAHRVLGRTIGLVFLLPFLYFLIRRKISRPLIPKLVAMFILGGLQGVLGWYMVMSGLIDKPHVSQYRLTAHLLAAIAIYSYIFWVALGLIYPPGIGQNPPVSPVLRRKTLVITGMILLTIISGGFVAGLKAGHAYNTFPLMNGQWVPEGIMMLEPWYINFFENISTVQFDHRVLAILSFLAIIGLWFVSRRHDLPRTTRTGLHLLAGMSILQVILGISTLLLHVPVPLAATHQAGALVLLTLALFVYHRLHYS